MSETSFTDAKVIEMSRNFVNVIAHRETAHWDKETLVGKEKVKLCNDYHTIPCSVHVKGEEAIGKFFQGAFGTPTAVFCDPTGKELFKVPGSMSSSELTKKMQEALGKVTGEKIPLPMWQASQKGIQDGDAFLAKGDVRKSVEAYTKVGKFRGAAFKKMSEESLEKVNAEGEAKLKEALALENVEEKKKALRKIADDYKPLACSAQAKKELEGIK